MSGMHAICVQMMRRQLTQADAWNKIVFYAKINDTWNIRLWQAYGDKVKNKEKK